MVALGNGGATFCENITGLTFLKLDWNVIKWHFIHFYAPQHHFVVQYSVCQHAVLCKILHVLLFPVHTSTVVCCKWNLYYISQIALCMHWDCEWALICLKLILGKKTWGVWYRRVQVTTIFGTTEKKLPESSNLWSNILLFY